MHGSQAKPVLVPSQEVILPGLYLHVPFCASTCDFCAFYQEAPRRAELMRYLDGVERELDQWRAEWDAECDQGALPPAPGGGLTVFFGGGTPGLLAAPEMARLCRAVADRAPDDIAEWTVEMAPSTVKADKVAAMLEAGVTRISLGAQSFHESLLKKLGRRHGPDQATRAYACLREAGCENVNFDLIFAVPGQSREQWAEDLRRAIELGPEHISTYCLTFEEDTKLWAKLARGEFKRDIEQEADLYQFTWETLECAGYAQYEISNFARPGMACAHNLSTWRMGAWRGVGPSAASQWRGLRWANPANLDEWLAGLDQWRLDGHPAADEITVLSEDLLADDALIFGLRRNEGVNLAALRDRFPGARWHQYEPLWFTLAEEGFLTQIGDAIRLTVSGRLLADSVGARILEAQD